MQVWLFDIDGTLIHSGGAGQAAMAATMATLFGTEADAGDIAFAGRTDRSILSDLFRMHGVRETAENVSTFCDEYLKVLGSYLESREGSELPGVRMWLDAVDSNTKTHLGLLTGNLRRGAERKLSHFGLWDFFDFGGFGDEHLDRDDVAREALASAHDHARTQIDPTRVWVVGDTPCDIRCARAIGANVIAVATGGHSTDELSDADPDYLLANLSDITLLEEHLP